MHSDAPGWLSHIAEIGCRQLMKSLPVAFYTCDMWGRITFFNEASAALWGREPVLGRDMWCGSWKIYRPDGTPLALDDCPMAVTLRERRAVVGEEIEIGRPDGVRRSMLPHPQPILDGRGEMIGAVNMLVDITSRKQVEQALQAAKEQAEAANRAKDRFLAVLSHELRTPLTPVLMTVAALEVDPELPEEMRSDMGMIRRNIELETRLIDDLLDMSRITSGKVLLNFTSVDLNVAVRDVCGIGRPLVLEKGISLSVKLDEQVGAVRADGARLRQMLWNLLKNAVKFTPAGGKIWVRTSMSVPGRVKVEISDNGVGISDSALPHIFEAFGQASERIARQYGGMGLGLAISRALVELHNGTMTAKSGGEGSGSTFTIELPSTASVKINVASKTLPADEVRVHPKLLLVEDHVDTSEALRKLLQSTGYDVRCSRSVAGALEMMAREPFDVLVSDVGLPDASGYELMRQISRLYPVKGIAISGYGMAADVEKSRESGFSDHLVKPIKIEELERAIERIVHPEEL